MLLSRHHTHCELSNGAWTKLSAAVQEHLQICKLDLSIVSVLVMGLLPPEVAGRLFQLHTIPEFRFSGKA